MINIKTILDFDKIKPFAIAALCFLAVFLAGYGTGRKTGDVTKRSLTNYTTKAVGETKPPDKTEQNAVVKAEPTANDTGTGECYIKGSKSKIYHMPGGSFYERTSAAACFGSEEEAIAAGYTKSSR